MNADYFVELWSGFEEGSYLRLDSVSLNSRFESNKEKDEERGRAWARIRAKRGEGGWRSSAHASMKRNTLRRVEG
jgi:hypothetical protein